MIDKMTNGFIVITDISEIPNIQHQLIHNYRLECLRDFGVDVKVKVNIEKIEESTEHIFTHRFNVRCTEKVKRKSKK